MMPVSSTQQPAPLTAWGSVTAPSGQPVGADRYRELDGHRGIAIVAIVVYHVYQFSNIDHNLYRGTPAYTVINSLDAAVPWFFVLSAFLLFEPIARSAIDRGPVITARGFLARRAVRLIPVYYVAVIVVWFLRQQRLPGDWRDLLEHLTFTQVFDAKRIFFTNGPAWSLSVSVYFYLALTVLGVVLVRHCRQIARRSRRITLLAAATAALGVISLVWKAWSFGGAHRPTDGSFTTWFGPLANLDNFAIGMAVALVCAASKNSRRLNAHRRIALRLAGVTILVLAFVTRRVDTWPAVYFTTECSAGFGCLIAAGVLGPAKDPWARALSWRPLRWLGAISFSVYLWHEPVMLAMRGSYGLVHQIPGDFVANTLVVTFASIVIGWISYTLIEKPTSQLGGIFRRDGHLRNPGNNPIEWETFRSGNPL